MGTSKAEAELKEAETIMAQILSFRQYGAPAGTSPKNVQNLLDKTVEHFLRRDEPESIYYGRFEESENPDQLYLTKLFEAPSEIHDASEPGPMVSSRSLAEKDSTFPDGCVCGEWSDSKNEVHLITAPCFMVEDE